MSKLDDDAIVQQLKRIADAMERHWPPLPKRADVVHAEAYVWHSDIRKLVPVRSVNRLAISLLLGVNEQRDLLMANTSAFANKLPANNALLWGARGTGKSSLVKSVHGTISASGLDCGLVEIHREDIADLPLVMNFLSTIDRQFVVFCDDLAFEKGESTYKSLKAALDGGIEGRPENVIFYATSNRRHLMSRQMIENERSSAISPSETTEETVSLSDRFGLWIGFHSIDQDTYIDMIDKYIQYFNIKADGIDTRAQALAWSVNRGARSGRVAWQYIIDLAARTNTRLEQKN